VTVRAKDAVNYVLKSDGSAELTYALARSFQLSKYHMVKLLCVAHSAQPILVCSNFVQAQPVGREMLPVLGTSVGSCNVYLPVSIDYLPAVGCFRILHVNGEPVTQLYDIVLTLHFSPKHALCMAQH
jgi:hypothetical protein